MTSANPGDRFGRLVVVEQADDYVTPSGKKYPRYLCQCDCGKTKLIDKNNLLKGKTLSCGCLQKERASAARKTHGDTDSRLYNVWSAIKRRCYNKDVPEYQRYGARGIYMCDEWRESYNAFREWALSAGYDYNAPHGMCTIDRINNEDGYHPDNCRWVSQEVQMNNVGYNHHETYNGETHTIAEWEKLLNIKRGKIFNRMRYGWSFEEAILAPSDARKTRGHNHQ